MIATPVEKQSINQGGQHENELQGSYCTRRCGSWRNYRRRRRRNIPACTTAVPPAYIIAEVQVTDPDIWKQYLAVLPGTLEPYKTRTLVRAVPVALDSSTPPAGTLVVIAFNSMDDVKAFWNSPAYQAIIPLREKSSKTRVYAVQGVPPS
jgi:uncharacterized protein (DUF1330 family)